MTRPHLQFQTTERGFKNLPYIRGTRDEYVRVFESSAADHPHIWLSAIAPKNLNQPEGEKVEANLHLTAEAARNLAEQLLLLADGHYQNAPVTPDHMQDGKRYRLIFEGEFRRYPTADIEGNNGELIEFDPAEGETVVACAYDLSNATRIEAIS